LRGRKRERMGNWGTGVKSRAKKGKTRLKSSQWHAVNKEICRGKYGKGALCRNNEAKKVQSTSFLVKRQEARQGRGRGGMEGWGIGGCCEAEQSAAWRSEKKQKKSQMTKTKEGRRQLNQYFRRCRMRGKEWWERRKEGLTSDRKGQFPT